MIKIGTSLAAYRPIPGIVLLLSINALVCRDLWFADFTNQLCSVEGSFISISRYAMSHWGDLKWFPLWFCGMPFFQVYQPGLHLTVAAVGTWFHARPERVYHVLTALLYCLGPASFYALFYRATRVHKSALLAGLIYSLCSPAALVSASVRSDLGGMWLARRYQTLVHYGEGPHLAVLTLLPLVIVSLDHVFCGSTRSWHKSFWTFTLILLLAAVALTNWTGTIGVAFAVLAYVLSRAGTLNYAASLLHLAVSVLIAYAIASPWIPPSLIASIPLNAQRSDGTYFTARHGLWLLGAGLLCVLLHYVFQKSAASPWLRFFVYFSLFTSAVVLGFYWMDARLLPQPHRWQLELEMAFVGLFVYAGTSLLRRTAAVYQLSATLAIALFLVCQLVTYRHYAHSQTLPIDIRTTVEYEMANWFDHNMHGVRVFAPGSVSLWMNVFTDVPQMVGCCDQSVPSFEQRVAFYTIYTGQNTGTRDAEYSLLWLQAFGAQAIGVSGPHGREFFKSFANPYKFANILPELWKSGDDVIYRVPSRSASLAHVIPEAAIVSRSPVDGTDVAPLVPYVQALGDPRLPLAQQETLSARALRISAELRPGQLISVQINYASGWTAATNGRRPVRIEKDGLGLMIIRPECTGMCVIDLLYDGGTEARYTRVAQVLGLAALLALWRLDLAHALLRAVSRLISTPVWTI